MQEKRVNFHDFSAGDAVFLLAYSTLLTYIYEQATPETRRMIAKDLEDKVTEWLVPGAVDNVETECFLRNAAIVLSAKWDEDGLVNHTSVEVDCG